ncbi:MAG: glycerol-3-phosphate acyltransferase [Leptolyngbyaceae cyanobacterium MO_188.B28]|nr:glycerol-3-phosphate acyltransferase [Leptolyngbyaceae cyanobacterium MO_188.B28]
MTLTQVSGAFLIFILCPVIGGLPLIAWITRSLTGKRLSQVGTGNVSVSATFYHGGRLAGILAVCAEALKGVSAVLLARRFFPDDPTWEVIALIALVMGRYWFAKGAGTTNVFWGFTVHDPIVAGLTFLISFISFTVFRERKQGRLGVLVVLTVMTALLHSQNGARVLAVAALSSLIAWIYHKIPDDLDMPVSEGRLESRKLFRFFQGDRALLSLDQSLNPERVGNKAATLAQLRSWGYPVPRGYVLLAGDDPAALIAIAQPSPQQPIVVRSSAIGEDSLTASAAGQYVSILGITAQSALESAITRCFASYNGSTAAQYRQDRGLPNQGMAVIVQQQVQGVFSGVAFSRDPIARYGDAVVIEALPGPAAAVVSGKVTPEQYRIPIQDRDMAPADPAGDNPVSWLLPESLNLEVEGSGKVPPRLLQQVAFLARHLEIRFHGVPQDIEWSYDGQGLWLLQSRPITTLSPIWTRKIAAEVIPGVIHPLTWSINRPLTCGVWGEIFTLVLGKRAQGLDFGETARLHHSRAYFNASLLGDIFLRMGLPTESLEFLTRGAKFRKPPLLSTLRNIPGLIRLVRRELRLEKDFRRDAKERFAPTIEDLAAQPAPGLSPEALLDRIDRILELLQSATYYSILAPLSLAVRQALFKVNDNVLDNSQNPEVIALRDLQEIARTSRHLLTSLDSLPDSCSTLFALLSESPDGQTILKRIDGYLEQYGYLSEVGTDIAVPTWKENPGPVRQLFTQYLINPLANKPREMDSGASIAQDRKTQRVQRRLDLKGQVTQVYSLLLAELRWSFVALEKIWLSQGVLQESGELFFLEFDQIRQLILHPNSDLQGRLTSAIAERRSRLKQDHKLTPTPNLVYGNEPPRITTSRLTSSAAIPAQVFTGIGASSGQAEGEVRVLHTLQNLPEINDRMILVVPFTDSGWAPLLARSGGLVAEVGGRLSHGAIIAREYGIPAVMNVPNATQQLRDGQRVRLDGQTGVVEVLQRSAEEWVQN